MTQLLALIISILTSASSARTTVSIVPCKTVADCWLDADGAPIARPKAKRGQPLPRGNCGDKHNWLSTRLSCENQVCVAVHRGDKC